MEFLPRLLSLWKCRLTSIENPIVKISRSKGGLIFAMGLSILVKLYLFIEIPQIPSRLYVKEFPVNMVLECNPAHACKYLHRTDFGWIWTGRFAMWWQTNIKHVKVSHFAKQAFVWKYKIIYSTSYEICTQNTLCDTLFWLDINRCSYIHDGSGANIMIYHVMWTNPSVVIIGVASWVINVMSND